MVREVERKVQSGWLVFPLLFAILVATIYGFVRAASAPEPDGLMILVWVVVFVVDFFGWLGFFIINPNEAKVLQLFGNYVGTVKAAGFHWANPLYSKRRISLRIRNFETTRLKVNDLEGNPIEIAAVVVWRVVETAEACFEVDDYTNYVHVQSESAIRNLSTSYAYDSHVENQMSLRGNTAEVAAHLQTEIQDRLSKAGVEVIEARISHLAYAPEIAAAMLQRRRRRGDGRDGPRASQPEGHRPPRRGSKSRHGQQPARRPVRRTSRPAGRQHRNHLSVGRDCG